MTDERISDPHRSTWERYVACWRAAEEDDKRAIMADCLDDDCVYTDPLTVARGTDALLAYMLDFHRQIPGGHFVTTYFLAHHDRSVARWEMRAGDGSLLGDGMSYAEYRTDGRLTAMTGFFATPGG
ncbi:MAG: nuclear transport factor 2 family protein [Myxococcales bacterium]|nr:nuclear transport factor 2 family protein [Myxococcales bacterium]